MKFADLPEKQQAIWYEMVANLGIDYTARSMPFGRICIAPDLDTFVKNFNIKPLPNVRQSLAEARSFTELSSEDVRHALIHHVNGSAPITDAGVKAALNKAAGPFLFEAQVAQDITVTASNPLIINSNTTVTAYGVVTIKDGGYIQISVLCHFQAVTLLKESTSGASPGKGYDFLILGSNGNRGSDGAQGTAGKDGTEGAALVVKCAGDDIPGSPGGKGNNGGNGNDGLPGGDGGNSPSVVITIQKDLQATISVLNQGGDGGNGSNGGNGGKGGKGGKGGYEGHCGAYLEKGGNGGNGGTGGTGGNGGNSIITFKSNNGSTVLTTNGQARGGQGSTGGSAGEGGEGGASGGRGAKPGDPGSSGTSAGTNGHQGNLGGSGTIEI